ncbi:GNAT family N-acetyltransferase [Kocuria sp. KD4]|uniref:GNAT family N-acetyltransferase n=1 Tax=Kocuria sp. KD4 TaxID=2719588 RepID=UPI0014278153|nr:GNAT family protein [Kocuria sp. KD4]QIR70640.1 GNAT family N-acetyltransferase [Kocuria sp. KD4]
MTKDTLSTPEAALEYGTRLLRGTTVQLRSTTRADIEVLTGWWSRPEWAALQQPMIKPRPRTSIADMFARWSANDAASGAGFSIDNVDGDLVGHATLWGATLPARIATYAIVIGPDFVGRGYGTDATKVMLRYAFQELGAHKVELQTWAYNTRARRAYEKAGFVTEGVRRAAAFHNGAFHDEIQMGILVDEYRHSSESGS